MEDCQDTCVLESYDDCDGEAQWFVTTPKARKKHVCCECRQPIPVGARYENAVSMYDGTTNRLKTCLLCVEIREKFSCGGGYIFTEMWDTLREHLFGRLRFECLKGLSTEAHEKVLSEWRRWKGLATQCH